jgi:hypothetical protein
MRRLILSLAVAGLALGMGAYVVYPSGPPEPPAIRIEVVGLADPVPAGGHLGFALRVHNPSREAVEVIGIDGLGCKAAGCLATGDGPNPLGRVIPPGETLDVPLTVALRGGDTLATTVCVYLRSSAGLVQASVEVVAVASGPTAERAH